MTRQVTPEMIQRARVELRKLENDWELLNRKTVNKELRSSLYTKIVETKARIAAMEIQYRKTLRSKMKDQASTDAIAS